MMTKKNMFFVGLVALVVIILILALDLNFDGYCVYRPESDWSTNYCDVFMLTLSPLLLAIPFSLLLYFLRDEVFVYWMKFAKWGVLLLMFFSILAGSVHRSGSIGFEFFPFTLIFLYIAFLLTSLILITYKFFKLKKI